MSQCKPFFKMQNLKVGYEVHIFWYGYTYMPNCRTISVIDLAVDRLYTHTHTFTHRNTNIAFCYYCKILKPVNKFFFYQMGICIMCIAYPQAIQYDFISSMRDLGLFYFSIVLLILFNFVLIVLLLQKQKRILFISHIIIYLQRQVQTIQ